MTKNVQLEPHGWSSEQLARLKEQLQGIPELGEAYLARRIVGFLPEYPCFVLCVRASREWWQHHDSKKSAALTQAILQQVVSPLPYTLYVLAGPLKPLRRTLARMPGARVV